MRYCTSRSRCVYALLIVLVTALGLFSRSSFAEFLPAFISTYAGDTLWSLALYLFLGFLFPRIPTVRLASLALALSFGVELSQLYQADWIDGIRGTRIGGLILGFGFKWSDLICYTVGVCIGCLGERLAGRNRKV